MVFGSQAIGNGSTGVAPRFGFAYQVGNNSVIRGGFAEYFGATIAGSWAGNPYPTNGFSTNPTVSNVTGGVTPAYYFGNGFPASAITYPPDINPAVENGASPVGVLPDSYEMPRYLNYTASFQHQWHNNMDLTVAYVGNHATRLPINAWNLGPETNENAGSVLQYGSLLTSGAFNNGVPNTQLTDAKITTPPYPGFTGDLAQALRPYPQYQEVSWREGHTGASHYNALQVQLNKHWKSNLTTLSYTYSRLMNNSAESGEAQCCGGSGSGVSPQNPSNFHDMWGLSVDDVPNTLAISEVYTLPFGNGQKFGSGVSSAVNKFIGNWNVSGILSYESGRPQTIYENSELGSYLFDNGTQFPNVVAGQNPLTGGSFTNPFSQVYYNANASSNPGPFAFGDATRTTSNIRGPHYYNEDLSIYKDTYFGEARYVRFQATAGNLLNRVDFCPPNSTVNSGAFGTTFTQCNVPRRIQMNLEVFF